jgi:hypothetical protein
VSRAIILLLALSSLPAQESPLDHVKQEAERLKALQEKDTDQDLTKTITPLHLALRTWIESHLPGDRGLLLREFGALETTLQSELTRVGLHAPEAKDDPAADPFDGPGFGSVSVELTRLPEMPDSLFVTAGVSVPCGVDQRVYEYDFGVDNRKRVLEDRPKESGYYRRGLELSDPDRNGNRLLLIHYSSVQCNSTWMQVAYSVHRVGPLIDRPKNLLTDEHGFWLGNDGPEFVLKPNEMIMELLDRSLDVGIHNRTQIHRYNFDNGAQRVDPVAFQPQDFVEEWLGGSWDEMQPKSATETEEWHSKLEADYSFGEYDNVVPCLYRPGHTLVSIVTIEVSDTGEMTLKPPREVYFLVRDLGQYRYRMEAVSNAPIQGCPGTGSASRTHPWLSANDLRRLK